MAICLCLASSNISAADTNVYLFPGQGADGRQFSELTWPSNYQTRIIEYGTPAPNENMRDFALRLSRRIDQSKPFILVGVSLGGMLCVELSEILHPEKTIIISSAKCRSELPFRYRFQRVIPLYRAFPQKVLLFGAKLLQPIVEPDRNKYKETFKSMLGAKSPRYMKRTIGMIINWEREIPPDKEIIHIHGDKDHTLPLRNINNPDAVIEGGSHMMVLTRAREISEKLGDALQHELEHHVNQTSRE